MRWWLLGTLTLVLVGCVTALTNPKVEIMDTFTSPGGPFRADLDDLGMAPELDNEVWLNTESPLRLADLRGKVVLLDMWTFG